MSTIIIFFPPNKKPSVFKSYFFRTKTFDLDVLIILFKYRVPVHGFPGQLNRGFNGALFSAYGTDFYKLYYQETPLHVATRQVTHYGFSVGGFSGLGTACIDDYVTLNRINYQYDGVVISTELAAELGFNKINFGLPYGFDFLTDRNKHIWINNGKPWVGISLGLNLN